MIEILHEECDNLNPEEHEKIGNVYELTRDFDKNINWVRRNHE
jgi:hypothetical protein